MNFKVPQPDDDFDYYGNSSQDESRGSQGSYLKNSVKIVCKCISFKFC